MHARILFSLLGLFTGILAGAGLILPDQTVVTSLVALILLGMIPFILKGVRKTGKPGWIKGRSLIYLMCFFSAGYVAVRLNRIVIPADSTRLVRITARVGMVRKVSDKMIQVVIRPIRINPDSAGRSLHGRMVILTRPGKDTLRAGEIREFGPTRINRISSLPNAGGFIPSRYWRSLGIEYEAWAYSGQMRLIKAVQRVNLWERFSLWQENLVNRIQKMDLSPGSAGLLSAMIFGDMGAMEKEVIQVFSKAGIVHVLSVSGLHVGIIFLVISRIISFLPFIPAKLKPVFSLVFVWVYTGISGFSNSACRAAGMVSLFGLARMTNRTNSGLNILGGMALIHCLINPFLIFSAGGQLSYLAVAGIFIWTPVFKPVITGGWVKRKLISSISISLAAQSLLIPVLLYWFGWIPLYFLIGNLILLPLLVLAFYLGLALVVMDGAGINFLPLCRLVDLLVQFSTRGADLLGNLPGNVLEPGSMQLTEVFLYYTVLFMAYRYLRNPSPQIVKRLLLISGVVLLLSWVQRILA